MAKIQIDLSESLNKALKVHKLRNDFVTLQEALTDVLERFFSKLDAEYFIKANEDLKKRKKPKGEYVKKL